MFLVVCLCPQNNLQSYGQIAMNVQDILTLELKNRCYNFGGDLDHYLDPEIFEGLFSLGS